MPATEPMEGRCGSPLAKRPGEFCSHRAGFRTDHDGLGHCWLHGGRQETYDSPRVIADARAKMERFGAPRDGLDPRLALLEEIARTAGHVDWLAAQLGLLGNDDELIRGVRSVSRETGTGFDRTGDVVPIDKTTTVIGPGQHMLWQLYTEERDRLVRVCDRAIKLGIAEREVRVKEEQGRLASRLLTAVLGDLDLTEEQRGAVPQLVRRHLSLVRPDVA